MSTRPIQATTLTVFVLALVVRLVYLFESASGPAFDLPLIDSETYDRLARHLVSGGGLTDEFFWQPVFYPFFLAGVYLVTGGSALAAKLLQIGLGALTCALTCHLGREVFDRRTGFLAGLFAAFCGPLLFFDAELLATGWAAFWSIALLLLFLRAGRRAPRLHAFVTPAALGLCLGLAAITRPTFVPFALVGSVWLMIVWRRQKASTTAIFAGLASVFAGFLLIVLPVASLSARVTGRTGFLPASAGINLFIGNNPERARTLNIRPGWEWDRLTRSPRLEGVTEKKDTSRYFTDRVLKYATTDPIGYVGGLVTKSGEMLSSRELPRNLDIYVFRDWSSTLSILVWKVNRFGFPLGILLPLAALGLIRLRSRLPAPIPMFLLVYACAVVLVFVSSRYRTPILPVLCLPAAAGALGLIDALRRRERRELTISGLVLVAFALLATIPGPFPQERGDYGAELYFLVGRRATDGGDLDAAVRYHRQALARNPRHANANAALARLLSDQGQTDEAIELYERALETEPNHVVALANLGRILARQQDHAGALRNLDRAIEITPLDTDLYEDCATILGWQGRLTEALEYLDRAMQIRPDDSDLHYRTGRVLETLGRFGPAMEALAEAIRLDGLNREAIDAMAQMLVHGQRRTEARALYEAALERAEAAGQAELEKHLRTRLRFLDLHER